MSNILLLVTYFTAAVLLSLFLVYVKGPTFLKMLLIAFAFCMTVLTMFSFESYKGWASTELPNNGQILAVQVVEDKAIYIWIDEETKTKAEYWYDFILYKDDTPRLYSLPYTEEAAKEYTEVEINLSKGYYIRGTFRGKSISNGVIVDQVLETPEIEMIPPDELLVK